MFSFFLSFLGCCFAFGAVLAAVIGLIGGSLMLFAFLVGINDEAPTPEHDRMIVLRMRILLVTIGASVLFFLVR